MIYKTLLRFLKILLASLCILLCLILIYLAAAFGLARIPVNKSPEQKNDVSIYILSNGVHTDIVVPVKTEVMDWSELVKFEHTKGQDTSAPLLGFGWGDKGFYLQTPTWADLKASVAFNAAFGLGESAMHTTFYGSLNENDNCKRINLSSNAYQDLVVYLSSGFQLDSKGNFMAIKTNANYSMNDAFYEGVGRYNMFYTCNTWANNALKACNQTAALWTPFETGIFYHYSGK